MSQHEPDSHDVIPSEQSLTNNQAGQAVVTTNALQISPAELNATKTKNPDPSLGKIIYALAGAHSSRSRWLWRLANPRIRSAANLNIKLATKLGDRVITHLNLVDAQKKEVSLNLQKDCTVYFHLKNINYAVQPSLDLHYQYDAAQHISDKVVNNAAFKHTVTAAIASKPGILANAIRRLTLTLASNF